MHLLLIDLILYYRVSLSFIDIWAIILGQSAYMLWLNENRARLTKPGMGVTDVAKAAGAEWRQLSDKTKWEGMAAADKKRYEKEMASFKTGDYVAPPKKTNVCSFYSSQIILPHPKWSFFVLPSNPPETGPSLAYFAP